MKLLIVSIALFSSIANAGTICYTSKMAAVSEVFISIKNAINEVVHEAHIDNLTPGTERCLPFYEDEQSISLRVFHHTGLVWNPKANTCNFENITKSTKITSHGNVYIYHCTEEEI